MKSRSGASPPGNIVNPQELPEEPVATNAEPIAAPPPGLPVSDEEYERLKEAAKKAPPTRVKNAQKDRRKKQKKKAKRNR